MGTLQVGRDAVLFAGAVFGNKVAMLLLKKTEQRLVRVANV